VSFVGYAELERRVTVGAGAAVLDIAFQSAGSKDLDEVLVVGYGTQKKATKTGAVAQVSGEDLKAAPVVNAESSLVGRVPGVMAMNRSGEPGNDGSRILRSSSSMASPMRTV